MRTIRAGVLRLPDQVLTYGVLIGDGQCIKPGLYNLGNGVCASIFIGDGEDDRMSLRIRVDLIRWMLNCICLTIAHVPGPCQIKCTGTLVLKADLERRNAGNRRIRVGGEGRHRWLEHSGQTWKDLGHLATWQVGNDRKRD